MPMFSTDDVALLAFGLSLQAASPATASMPASASAMVRDLRIILPCRSWTGTCNIAAGPHERRLRRGSGSATLGLDGCRTADGERGGNDGWRRGQRCPVKVLKQQPRGRLAHLTKRLAHRGQ